MGTISLTGVPFWMVVRVPIFVRLDGDYKRMMDLTVALAGLTAISAVPWLDASLEVVFLDIKMELYHISNDQYFPRKCNKPS